MHSWSVATSLLTVSQVIVLMYPTRWIAYATIVTSQMLEWSLSGMSHCTGFRELMLGNFIVFDLQGM